MCKKSYKWAKLRRSFQKFAPRLITTLFIMQKYQRFSLSNTRNESNITVAII